MVVAALAALGVVALRKESVDRNGNHRNRRCAGGVALRKESVDRNQKPDGKFAYNAASLSARRAWIEIKVGLKGALKKLGRSPQGERG